MGGAVPAAVAARYFAGSTSLVVKTALTVMLGYSFWKSTTTCLKNGSRAASLGCQISNDTGALLADDPAWPGAQAADTMPAAPATPHRTALRLTPLRDNVPGCSISTSSTFFGASPGPTG